MNLALLRYFDYSGKNSKLIDEILRRVGLTTLLFLSPTGHIPHRKRSNQFLMKQRFL